MCASSICWKDSFLLWIALALVKNKLTIEVWVYFRTPYSTPSIWDQMYIFKLSKYKKIIEVSLSLYSHTNNFSFLNFVEIIVVYNAMWDSKALFLLNVYAFSIDYLLTTFNADFRCHPNQMFISHIICMYTKYIYFFF